MSQKIIWQWPAKGKILSRFSSRDPGQKGIDMAGRTGQPIYAAQRGYVVYSGSGLRGYGKLIIVKHNETFLSAYAHNQKLLVKEGQKVKRGQIIDYVGNTGKYTGPHLHYEFLVNGVHRNPRTVSLPKANPISKDEKQRFLALAESRMDMLQHNKNLLLAMR